MKKLSTFQIVVTGAFLFFIVVGVMLFATSSGLGGNANIGQVTIWGTYDDQIVNAVTRELSFDDSRFEEVTYVEKDARFFNDELVEALASGDGPDLFFLEQDTIVRHKDKIFPIPYDTMSERD